MESAQEIHLVPKCVMGLPKVEQPGLQFTPVRNALLNNKSNMRPIQKQIMAFSSSQHQEKSPEEKEKFQSLLHHAQPTPVSPGCSPHLPTALSEQSSEGYHL
jgi:hypothetical protein